MGQSGRHRNHGLPRHCCRSTYKAVKGLPIMSAHGVRILRNACVAAAAVSILQLAPARAEGPIVPNVAYTVDTVTLANTGSNRLYLLDNLDLTFNIDADRLLGTSGMSAFVFLLYNMGDRPNDSGQTLSGISSIEVPAPRFPTRRRPRSSPAAANAWTTRPAACWSPKPVCPARPASASASAPGATPANRLSSPRPRSAQPPRPSR